MPNIKSAEKRVEVTSRQNLRNRMIKSELKTALKKADAAIAAGNKEAVNDAYSAIDHACSKGVLHKNTAARKVSRLAAAVKKAQ